mmetsp:Transcript_15657/g.32469  ORF Transcript_15657/g.32469 Transcript_15657/m.32469 type:complete len:101 (+) Transcript_15657:323-625(+)
MSALCHATHNADTPLVFRNDERSEMCARLPCKCRNRSLLMRKIAKKMIRKVIATGLCKKKLFNLQDKRCRQCAKRMYMDAWCFAHLAPKKHVQLYILMHA